MFSTIELVNKIFFIWSIVILENFLKFFEKNHLIFSAHHFLKDFLIPPKILKEFLKDFFKKSQKNPTFFSKKPIMIMGWKVIWGVLYQVLALIWSSETLLRRFSIFEKKVAKIRILAKNGLWSLQRARVTSDRKIWSYGVWNLLDPFF